MVLVRAAKSIDPVRIWLLSIFAPQRNMWTALRMRVITATTTFCYLGHRHHPVLSFHSTNRKADSYSPTLGSFLRSDPHHSIDSMLNPHLTISYFSSRWIYSKVNFHQNCSNCFVSFLLQNLSSLTKYCKIGRTLTFGTYRLPCFCFIS